jgi:hypothetical protein
LIDNPKYKGEWKAPMIDNPAFKGVWKARQIDNPKYTEEVAVYDNIGAVGFEVRLAREWSHRTHVFHWCAWWVSWAVVDRELGHCV